MSQYTLKISEERAKEMPMVDLAFEILKASNTPYYYRDLMQEIAKIKGISDDEIMQVIAQLYTEINIDGRFACVGNNLWGLKRWYPIDKQDDMAGSGTRPRIINDDDDDEDDDLFEEEHDEDYLSDDEDDFDSVGDDDEIFPDDEDDLPDELDPELDEELEADEDFEDELDDSAEDFEDTDDEEDQ
jgi:DNA-directed RNA polymerase subunit delta